MEQDEAAEPQVTMDTELLAAAEHPAISSLRAEYHGRLIAAGLRIEAVKAGMVDLDGLKLLDVSSVSLNDDDTVTNGPQIMQTLKKDKPWLFRAASSSSAAAAPSARPPRQKSALEMSDEEYATARKALIRF